MHTLATPRRTVYIVGIALVASFALASDHGIDHYVVRVECPHQCESSANPNVEDMRVA